MLGNEAVRPDKRAVETLLIEEPISYQEGLGLQIRRRDAIANNTASNALFLLQHTPVYTLGRKAKPEHLLLTEDALAAQGFDVVETDRGGDVTYHGPGQLVGYPILDLNQWKPSIGWYLRSLEEVLVRVLADYGLKGERLEGYTGVWVGGAKIAAIGIALRDWIAYHGIALNVDPDMTHFQNIVPCGIPDKPVTSLKILLDTAPTFLEVARLFEDHFRSSFNLSSDTSEAQNSAHSAASKSDLPKR